jgi:flavodoxin
MMRALVVFESMFGNTEAVARAVAGGLAGAMDVAVCEVSRAPAAVPGGVDVVVAGGPTHAFSMSRPESRAAAVEQGAPAERSVTGLREWLDGLGQTGRHTPVATFDTRVHKARRLPGSAARKALRVVRGQGFDTLGSVSFFVEDTTGPLLDGELDRAEAWGRSLAATCSAPSR